MAGGSLDIECSGQDTESVSSIRWELEPEALSRGVTIDDLNSGNTKVNIPDGILSSIDVTLNCYAIDNKSLESKKDTVVFGVFYRPILITSFSANTSPNNRLNVGHNHQGVHAPTIDLVSSNSFDDPKNKVVLIDSHKWEILDSASHSHISNPNSPDTTLLISENEELSEINIKHLKT